MELDVLREISIIKAQQIADMAVMAALIAAHHDRHALFERWKQLSPPEERAAMAAGGADYAHAFEERMSYWETLLESLAAQV